MSSLGTILLVDDERRFIDLVGLALKREGYAVAEANTGEQALERYPEIQPDLILLDVGLPGINGFEVSRRLIATHGEECAPILFFTAKTEPSEIAEGFDAGGADYLAKTAALNEIKARVRSHVQNHLLTKQQKLLAEQLARANVAKNRFIGMAAHDMRNPLVSIRGFAEFLMDGTVGEMPIRQRALVSIIHGTSNLMLKTLNELLDVATIEAGQLKLQRAPHKLADVVAKSVAQSAIAARKKRAKIVFEPPADAPAMMIDADKMRQAVDIVLNNAIKSSAAGAVIPVTVDVLRADNLCRLAVRDSGAGLAGQDSENVFKHLAGPAAHSPAEEKSAGVDLIICCNIVEAHGGNLQAENLPAGGCEVRVTLPLEPPPAPATG